MEIEEVIYDFLNEFGYTEDERIEGVIFYGSYQTKDRKSTRLNSSHSQQSRMPSSA